MSDKYILRCYRFIAESTAIFLKSNHVIKSVFNFSGVALV